MDLSVLDDVAEMNEGAKVIPNRNDVSDGKLISRHAPLVPCDYDHLQHPK